MGERARARARSMATATAFLRTIAVGCPSVQVDQRTTACQMGDSRTTGVHGTLLNTAASKTQIFAHRIFHFRQTSGRLDPCKPITLVNVIRAGTELFCIVQVTD